MGEIELRKEIIALLECIFIKGSLHNMDTLMGSILEECKTLGLVSMDDLGDYILTKEGVTLLTKFYYEKCKSNDNNMSHLQKFYDNNVVRILQYENLRTNFNKLVNDVLGKDYYNMAQDVYDSDRICCEDVIKKLNMSTFRSIVKKFI